MRQFREKRHTSARGSSRLAITIDGKGKPRPLISVQAARYLIEFARSQGREAVFEIQAEAVPPYGPYIRLIAPGSALFPAKGPEWTRTSFRVQRELRDKAKAVLAEMGLTFCEGIRIQLQNIVDLADNAKARRTPSNIV